MSDRRHPGGFTIIELLVVVSIIALLIGILLPAVSHAREQAKVSTSLTNLRNLAVANANYAATWNGQQFTLINHNMATYGSNIDSAFIGYRQAVGEEHPPIFLGWAKKHSNNVYANWILVSAGRGAYQPITFIADSGSGGDFFGAFRLSNVQAFNRFVNNRFYDPVYFAPKDTMVITTVEPGFDSPYEYRLKEETNNRIGWSSYCWSPAAMFHPDVMRNAERGGWQFPFQLPGAFRSPTVSQALYPELKTHMLEHHWLQNRRTECNSAFTHGTYLNCEPYYFNHGWASVPMTVFFDGHTEGLGVREAEQADARHLQQAGYGLWSRDTTFGENGYFIDAGYDQANTSFHILTTDGIRGRDKLGN